MDPPVSTTTELELVHALNEMRRIGFRPMALAGHRNVAPLLELALLGGRPLPTGVLEVRDRVSAARDLIRRVVPRLHDLGDTEFSELRNVSIDEERVRLEHAATLIFQLNRLKPKPREAAPNWGTLEEEASEFWGMGQRWFERQRRDFLLERLAAWILEEEHRHLEGAPPDDADEAKTPEEAEAPTEEAEADGHGEPKDFKATPIDFARAQDRFPGLANDGSASESVRELAQESGEPADSGTEEAAADGQVAVWFISVTLFSSVVLLGCCVILLLRVIS